MRDLVLLSSLFLVFFFTPNTVVSQERCATIESIKFDVAEVSSSTPFKCLVTVDRSSAGSKTIGCGISFNGEHPEDFCPSDTFFGGWNGNEAKFNCIFPNTNLPDSIQSVELSAFDFREECGPSTGKKITLPLKINNQTAPVDPFQQKNVVRSLLELLTVFNKKPTSQSTSPSIDPSVTPTPTFLPEVIPNIHLISKLIDTTKQNYSPFLLNASKVCLEHQKVYEQAQEYTGVPWQVLAGIHYREGNCGRNNSLVSGRIIGNNEPDLLGNCSSKVTGLGKPKPVAGGCGFQSLLDSAIYAANHLKGKIGRVPESTPSVVLALSRYNGTGNSNCGKTPYTNCPPQYPGEDDTYVMNFYDARHDPMYIVYCADYTLCNPAKLDQRPGVLTVTRIVTSF